MSTNSKNASPGQNTSELPPLVSKKWLGAHFGLAESNGRTRSRRLFSLVLTPQVLDAAGISIKDARCQSKKTFTATETNALYRALDLI